MKNTFGNNISLTLFGESHGETMGAVLDGIPSGIRVDERFIEKQLSKRRPIDKISTERVENDSFHILSGVKDGITCGTPICITVDNKDIKAQDYDELYLKPRPSHSDYAVFAKHGESGLLSGGGHLSGRLTAPIVAAGAIAISVLKDMGIKIGSHIKKIGDIEDRNFEDFNADIDKLNDCDFAVLTKEKADLMVEKIKQVKSEGNSIGGIIETAVTGLSAGIGEPWFDTIEGMLSHALFSIPAVKGIEFGSGFLFADMKGNEANDVLYFNGENVDFKTNHSGGILGGISSGAPIIFRVAIKPTPTISLPQATVDLKTNSNVTIKASGRHDPCIAVRAGVIINSITALTLLDMLTLKYGAEGIKNAIRDNRKDLNP